MNRRGRQGKVDREIRKIPKTDKWHIVVGYDDRASHIIGRLRIGRTAAASQAAGDFSSVIGTDVYRIEAAVQQRNEIVWDDSGHLGKIWLVRTMGIRLADFAV